MQTDYYHERFYFRRFHSFMNKWESEHLGWGIHTHLRAKGVCVFVCLDMLAHSFCSFFVVRRLTFLRDRSNSTAQTCMQSKPTGEGKGAEGKCHFFLIVLCSHAPR